MERGETIVKNDKIKFICAIVVFYLLIFQDFLQNKIHLFHYFDEALAFSVFPLAIYLIFYKKESIFKKTINKIFYGLFTLVFLIGFVSTLVYHIQPFGIALSDMIVFSKFFFAYSISELLISEDFVSKYRREICLNVRIVAAILFVSTILNYIFKIWSITDYRYGIMCNQLFYSRPTILAGVCIFLIALLMATSKDVYEKYFVILISLVLMSTLRFKAIAAALVALLIIIYVKKTKKKISLWKILLLGLVAIVIGWSQIKFYFIQIESARKVLNQTSVKIANDYFPLGSGFGTFACHFSNVHYSRLYYDYNISNVHGLSPNGKDFFFSDVFWPMILGQFGWFGLVVYVSLIAIIFKKIQDDYSPENINIYLAKMICLVYLLISSTSESAFVHYIAVPLALVIGINSNKKKDSR